MAMQKNGWEWETTQEAVAVVQARSNSSELGQVSQNGEDEVNLRGTSEERQQDLATDWTKDINGFQLKMTEVANTGKF